MKTATTTSVDNSHELALNHTRTNEEHPDAANKAQIQRWEQDRQEPVQERFLERLRRL
jgi:hypothetical protein